MYGDIRAVDFPKKKSIPIKPLLCDSLRKCGARLLRIPGFLEIHSIEALFGTGHLISR